MKQACSCDEQQYFNIQYLIFFEYIFFSNKRSVNVKHVRMLKDIDKEIFNPFDIFKVFSMNHSMF